MTTKPLPLLKKFLFLCLSIILIGCSATNRLTMSVTQPAPVNISKDVKRVGILSRFNSGSSSILNEIDKIFSAEGKNLDIDASNKLIEGLSEELIQINRFDVLKITDTTLVSDYTSNFPSVLTWDEVDNLCAKHDVDAIYTLSFFDTDSKISYSTKQVLKKNVLGLEIPVLEHHATSNTLIKGGFKVYDPANRVILDVFPFSKSVTVSGKGINPVKALEAMQMRKEVILEASRVIGANYAYSIVPQRVRVARDYFVRGSNQFEIGKRKAQTGDWDGAAQHWERELSNSKSKIAGRACYNMAIINEINGDLNAAIEWASKSYTDYKNRDALRYLNILRYRIAQNERLAAQQQ